MYSVVTKAIRIPSEAILPQPFLEKDEVPRGVTSSGSEDALHLFLIQPLHNSGIARKQEFPNLTAFFLITEKPLVNRNAEARFYPIDEPIWKLTAQNLTERLLAAPLARFALFSNQQFRRERGDQLRDADLGKRRPTLEPVHHGGDIYVGEDIRRQVMMNIDVARPGDRGCCHRLFTPAAH